MKGLQVVALSDTSTGWHIQRGNRRGRKQHLPLIIPLKSFIWWRNEKEIIHQVMKEMKYNIKRKGFNVDFKSDSKI